MHVKKVFQGWQTNHVTFKASFNPDDDTFLRSLKRTFYDAIIPEIVNQATMIKTIIKTGILFFTFIFITGVCAYLTVTWSIKNEDNVVVPELVEKDVVSVLEILTDLGLNTKVSGSEYTSVIPKNHVISQDPEPGTIIKRGRDVRIIFSKGPATTIIPKLKLMTVQEAGLALERSGLSEGAISYTYLASVPENTVITQYPVPNAPIQRGSRVNLLVSKGKRPEAYIMSDLSGMPIDDAILFIEKNNLKLGDIKSVPSDYAPRNTVTSHEPVAGSRVTEGSTVSLVINRSSGGGKQRTFDADAGPRLFSYKTGNGFLKKHIRAQLSCFGTIYDVFNSDVKPAETIWVLIPVNTEATLFLYEDNELIQTAFFD